MDRIILASQSPRRRELLTQMGLLFEILPSDNEEILDMTLSPEDAIAELSKQKAMDVWERSAPDAVVIAADTMVISGDEIMGKPQNADDAFRMLKKLSGSTHQVITAVTLIKADASDTRVSVTDVTFRSLSDSEILRYIDSGEPMDKAGAYGIQEKGAVLVSRIEGDFYGVMGLPVCLVKQMLDDMDISY